MREVALCRVCSERERAVGGTALGIHCKGEGGGWDWQTEGVGGRP